MADREQIVAVPPEVRLSTARTEGTPLPRFKFGPDIIKAKFGTRVRAKTPVAQVNEVLCKVLCHNLCCLVHAAYEIPEAV